MIKRFVNWWLTTFVGPDSPPPGFSIVTNGKHFRWAFPSGTISLTNKNSYRAACASCWKWGYSPNNEKAECWKKVG